MTDEETRSRKEQRPRQHRQGYTAFDRAMVHAAQNDTPVEFHMADGEVVTATIISVDKYFIEVDCKYQVGGGGKVWLNKAMMVKIRPLKLKPTSASV